MTLWLWLASGILGTLVSLYNAIDVTRDVRALRKMEQNEGMSDAGTHAAVRFFRNSEFIRTIQLVMAAAIGLAVLFVNELPLGVQRNLSIIIAWTLVTHIWLLTANTIQSFVYRRKIKKSASKEETNG